MTKQARLFLVLVLGLLGGCASAPSPEKQAAKERCYSLGEMRTCATYATPSRQQVADVRGLRRPPEGVSRLILVRNDWMDAHGQAQLTIDGTNLPVLIPCSVVGVDVKPGDHLLEAAHVSVAASQWRGTLGARELVLLSVKRLPRGAGSRGFSLHPLEATEAMKSIHECPLVGFLDQVATSGM